MAGVNGAFPSDFTRPIMPLMAPGAYKTYGMSMPLVTHWRQATCEEILCMHYLNGWKTILPADHEQVALVRSLKGRYSFTEEADDGLLEFTFAPGQPCFKASTHKLPLERPARLYVADGDWRRLGPARVHARAELWVEDFAEHQSTLAAAIERG